MRAWCGNNTLWFREHLEPLRMGANRDRSWVEWADQSTNDVAWHDGDLADVFNAILARRLVRAQQAGVNGWPDWSPRPARLADITDFIEGRINETLLADLIWGLSAVDWERVIREESRSVAENSTEHTLPTRETSAAENGDSNAVPGSADSEQRVVPSSFYALLRLCLLRDDNAREHEAVPLVPAIFYRAMNGQGKEASILAARRLRSSGMAPLVNQLPVSGDIARRTAAALLFPIAPRDFRLLERTILKPINTQNT